MQCSAFSHWWIAVQAKKPGRWPDYPEADLWSKCSFANSCSVCSLTGSDGTSTEAAQSRKGHKIMDHMRIGHIEPKSYTSFHSFPLDFPSLNMVLFVAGAKYSESISSKWAQPFRCDMLAHVARHGNSQTALRLERCGKRGFRAMARFPNHDCEYIHHVNHINRPQGSWFSMVFIG